jgi:hypothetical protein
MTLKNTRRSLWLVFLIQAIWFTSCHSYDKNYAIYELWVNGVKVTTRNQTDILGDGTARFEGNGQQGVLILEGACIDNLSDEDVEALVVSHIQHLTRRLVGENRIGMGEHVPVNGIQAAQLTIEGEGSLQIGARAACFRTQEIEVASGTIDAYIKTPDDEVAGILGVAL